MPEPWPLGTNAPKALKDALAAFINEVCQPFRERRFVVVSTGEKSGAGIKVELFSQTDPQPAHRYLGEDGREVLEEFHRVAIDVKADAKNGGAEAAEAVYEAIKSAVLSTLGREALIAQGVFDLREMPEAPVYGEVEFERPLHLSCNSDKYLT